MSKYVLRNPMVEAIKVEEPFDRVLKWCNDHSSIKADDQGSKGFSFLLDRNEQPVGIMFQRRIFAEKGEYIYVDPDAKESLIHRDGEGELLYMDGYKFEKKYMEAEKVAVTHE